MKKEQEKATNDNQEVINDIETLEGTLEKDGDFEPESSDAAPGASAESSGIGEMCTMMVSMVCGKAAQAYGEPLLALNKEDETALKMSITSVANYYNLDAHPLVGLGMVTAGITIPRYMMIQAIVAAHKEKEDKQSGD